MIKEGIVDSANLVKTALKIAVSIASSYLTSECAIIKNKNTIDNKPHFRVKL